MSMNVYDSYLERLDSGVYLTHAHRSGQDRTECGLPIAKLTTLEQIDEIFRLTSCARCLAFVEAAQTPRMRAEQMALLDWSGHDGR